MDALVMCGGRGSRFEADIEKPLFEIGDAPMIDRVLEALNGSRVDTVYRVTSDFAPATRAYVGGPSIETAGDGYVEDLREAMEAVELPVLTVAADLPLLDREIIDIVLDRFDGDSLTVVVPTALKQRLGLQPETERDLDGRSVTPTGLNVVGSSDAEQQYLTYDVRVALNVNRRPEATIAEELL